MSVIERALNLLTDGNWQAAHDLVQDDSTWQAAWVHAHIHRIEGDLPNARYWYRRAGKPENTSDLEVELQDLKSNLLGSTSR